MKISIWNCSSFELAVTSASGAPSGRVIAPGNIIELAVSSRPGYANVAIAHEPFRSEQWVRIWWDVPPGGNAVSATAPDSLKALIVPSVSYLAEMDFLTVKIGDMPRSDAAPPAAKGDPFSMPTPCPGAKSGPTAKSIAGVPFGDTLYTTFMADTTFPGLLGALAENTGKLRTALREVQSQNATLTTVFSRVRGLQTLVTIHEVYNSLKNPGWPKEANPPILTSVNKLFTKLVQSPAFIYKEGDVCETNAFAVNPSLKDGTSALISAIVTPLLGETFKTSYTDWVAKVMKAPMYGVYKIHEITFAHRIMADACQIVLDTLPLHKPSGLTASKGDVDKVGKCITQVATTPEGQLSSGCGTGTVFDVAIPTWRRLALSGSAGAAGATLSGLGADGLYLRSLLLYFHFNTAKLLNSPGEWKALRADLLPKLVRAGFSGEEAAKEFDKVLKKSAEVTKARTTASIAAGSNDAHFLKNANKYRQKAENLSRDLDDEVKGLKEFVQYDGVQKGIVQDGKFTNTVMGALAFIQFMDARATFDEQTKNGWDWKDLVADKAVADQTAAVLQFAGTAPVVLVRLFTNESVVFQAVRNTAKVGVPVLTAIGGALQMAQGLADGKPLDVTVGGLNVISGSALTVYAVMDLAEMEIGVFAACLPVVGQVAGAVAFLITVGVAIHDASIPGMVRFITASADDLKKKQLKGLSDPLVKTLAIADELEAFVTLSGKTSFTTIPNATGQSAEWFGNLLALYVGRDFVSEIQGP